MTLSAAHREKLQLLVASHDGANITSAQALMDALAVLPEERREVLALGEAALDGADLTGADLRHADLTGASLVGARLAGATLDGARAVRARLRAADLRDVRCDGADLSAADLRWADLRGARLESARLDGANLREADLRGAWYPDLPADVDVRGARRDERLPPEAGEEVTPVAGDLVVEPSGAGRHGDLTRALAGAPPGARVALSPGVYRGSFLVSRDLTLVATGPPGAVVLESRAGACLEVTAGEVRVVGVCFRRPPGSDGAAGLQVSGGRVVCEGIDVSSNPWSGIIVNGGARLTLHASRVHDCAQNGVLGYAKARLVVDGCDVFGNAFSNLEVKEEATATVVRSRLDGAGSDGVQANRARVEVRDCRLRDNGSVAVRVRAGATVEVRDAEVRGSGKAGILVVGDGANLTLRESRVEASGYAAVECNGGSAVVEGCELVGGALGLFAYDGAEVAMSLCRVVDSGGSGVLIDASAASLTGVTVAGCVGDGVLVRNGAQVRGDEIEVRGAGRSGVRVAAAPNVALSRCRVVGGEGVGLYWTDSPGGVLRDSEARDGAWQGLVVHGGELSVVGARFSGNARSGALIEAEARATFAACTFERQAGSGIMIQGDASATLTRCELRANESAGVNAHLGAVALDDCAVEGNRNGVMVADGARATVSGGHVAGSRESGIFAQGERARAVVSGCTVRDNGLSAIEACEGAGCDVRDCRIEGNRGAGVFFRSGAGGVVADCEIVGSTYAGIDVAAGPRVTVERCVVRGGARDGIRVRGAAEGVFRGCESTGNAWYGVAVVEDARPSLDGCRVHSNILGGVMVKGASGHLHGCEVLDNTGPGVSVSEGAAPRLEGCVLRGNGGDVKRGKGCEPIFTDCEVADGSDAPGGFVGRLWRRLRGEEV